MDIRALWEKAKEVAQEAAAEVEKQLKSLGEKLDRDKDGRPDVVERTLEEAQKALEEAKARLAELDRDQDGPPDRLKELAEAATRAGEAAKAKVEEVSRLLRERFGKED